MLSSCVIQHAIDHMRQKGKLVKSGFNKAIVFTNQNLTCHKLNPSVTTGLNLNHKNCKILDLLTDPSCCSPDTLLIREKKLVQLASTNK